MFSPYIYAIPKQRFKIERNANLIDRTLAFSSLNLIKHTVQVSVKTATYLDGLQGETSTELTHNKLHVWPILTCK